MPATKAPKKRPSTVDAVLPVDNVKAPRQVLTTDAIVDAACELIAETNAAELTMRRLSERLGVALGATYHHVANREALLALVAERINDNITLASTKPRDWRMALRQLMIDYAAAYAVYPGMAAFSIMNLGATSPQKLRVAVVELLHGAGFSPASASHVMAAFLFYTGGATAPELLSREQPGVPAKLIRKQFEHGLDMLLDGAQVQLRADRAAVKAAK